MRSFVQLFRAAKGIWLDPDATEGAVVGENLFLRLDDGTLALFQPDAGTIASGDGSVATVTMTNPAASAKARARSRSLTTRSVSVAVNGGTIGGRRLVRVSVPGSNSGYSPLANPTTAATNFDLDQTAIGGLIPALNPYPSVPDTAHGFTVGTIVRLNGTDYVKSQANNAVNAEAVGMVASIDDVNHFRICAGGRVTGLAGLVAGSVYFLSATTAGAMSLTDPLVGGVVGQVSKPVFIADSATSGYFVQLRGQVVGGGGSGGAGGSGALSLVGAPVVLAANNSTINSPALNLGADDCYLVMFDLKDATGSGVQAFSGYFNGDTVATNYDRETISISGAGVVSGAQTNTGVLGGLDANASGTGYLYIKNGLDGKPRITSTFQRNVTTNIVGSQSFNTWRTANNNVVLFSLVSAGLFAIGSKLTVYKISPVASSGGGYAEGAAFPASPVNGQKFYRTDLNLLFYYDGARWLSAQVFKMSLRWTPAAYGISTSVTTVDLLREGVPFLHGGSDLWLMNHHCQFIVASGGTALGASHSWIGDLHKYDTTVAPVTLATVTINSGASGVLRTIDSPINALLGAAYRFLFGTTWTKTGTPGGFQSWEEISYRIVG